ncbi:MAG: phosphatidylserine decarboxylase [Haloarculaceae archaeon]|jgi:phosphatidylserine decarboxylase
MQLAEGSLRWAALPLVPAVLVAPLSLLASGAFVGLAVFVLFFHRDPDRQTPPEGVVAPADGKVSVIREEDDRVRLGIYMSGRDVHVNRAPMDGVVESVEHEPGSNSFAFSKDAESNERLRFEFEDYTAEQIAGAIARRTYAYVEPGEAVERGQRIGHISFSSRFDVLFPPAYARSDLTVENGDRVLAGETVVASETPTSCEDSTEDVQTVGET